MPGDNLTAGPRPERAEHPCPKCGAVVPVHPGYVTWCDRCGWNLEPEKPPTQGRILRAIETAAGTGRGQRLLESLARPGSLRPTWTLSKVLALALATGVHGLTLGLAVLAVLWFVWQGTNPVGILLGLLCAALAWGVRPRLGRLPVDAVSRDAFPTLYRTADDVARALGAARVDVIAVDEQFDAAVGWATWRRKRVLTLGLPLLAILDHREKVAVVAHELAHNVNGDLSRTFFVGSALRSLYTWADLLRPDHIWNPNVGLRALVEAPFNLLMLGLSSLAWLAAHAFWLLLWQDSQRAEYLADSLAATVSGTEAICSMLDRLHSWRTVARAMQAARLSRSEANLFAELRRLVAEMPERERARIRAVQQMEASRLDATHPPTRHRLEFLRAHWVSQPKVLLPWADANQLERELATVEGRIQRRLMNLVSTTANF